jgi:HlyD family secretion protein
MDIRSNLTPKRLVLAGLGVAALAGLALAFRPAALPVETAPVGYGPLQVFVEQEGKTRARERYLVSAPLGGRFLRPTLKAGDAVTRGMRLATLLPADAPLRDLRTERDLLERAGAAEASLEKNRATVKRCEAAFEEARLEQDRTRQLVATGASPASALDRAQAEFRVREQELLAARQEAHAQEHELEVARLALDRLGGSRERAEIRSPLAGRVLRIQQESEAVVPPGAPLMELGRHGDLEVVADLLSSDAVQVKAGMPVRLVGWGGPELEGCVHRVEPGAFTKISPLGVEEQRVFVRVEITAPADRWLELGDGFRVEVRILTRALPRVLKVPTAALFREGGAWAAYLLEGRYARKRTLEIGQRNAEEAEVLKGLREGDRVILYPGEQVADGVRVNREPQP